MSPLIPLIALLACPGPTVSDDAGAGDDAAVADAGPMNCEALPGSVQVGQLGEAGDHQTTPVRRLVLMGGSTEVDTASADFVEAAGGGDVLVLRASGSTESYTGYFFTELYTHPAPASVTTLLLDQPEAAGAPAVLCRVDAAEAIWLAGGDQWDYLGRWPEALHQALARASSRGAALGGTSAGAMVLGQWAFDAEQGGLSSAEALAAPMDLAVSLSTPVFALPELSHSLVDTHFSQRDREGRLLVFLAHALERRGDGAVLGLGLDERTALVIEAGSFEVMAPSGSALWVYEVVGPATLASGQALDLEGVRRFRLAGGSNGSWPLDLGAWPSESLRVSAGVVE